jgi:pilus assembly protein FimV
MRAQPRWGVLPLLAAPVGTWALGLGEIELQSALNQPFQAQIALVSPTTDDLQGLTVTLANQATFERYGLDRPNFLTDMQFRVGRDDAGRDVIVVNSRESIAEPFVTLLVEATWPSGRSLREYTVLLDPPLLLPEPAVQAPLQPAQSRASEPAGAAPIQRPAAQQPVARNNVAPPAAPRASAPAASVGGSYGPVQRAETLWGIASRLQTGGVSVNQMMVAIFQANPRAFDSNMNLLRAGAVLNIPQLSELQRIGQADATAEVRRQAAAWQGTGSGEQQARLRLLAPTEQSAAGVQTGNGNTQVDANAAEVDSLRGEVNSLQSELAESRRLLELRNQELQDLQARLGEAQAAPNEAVVEPEAAPPAAADPGVELESDQVFADEPEAPVEELESEPAPVVQAAPRVPVAAAPAEPSLVSKIIGFLTAPLALIGLGVGALLLTALLFMRRRRDDVEDVTGRWEALEAEVDAQDEEVAATARLRKQSTRKVDEDIVVVEQPRDGEDAADALLAGDDDEPRFRRSAPQAEPEASDETLSSQTVINLDQADPVAEADFHMAYGLYDQAAELVAKALQAKPDSRSLKLKLLEVFFVWGNKESFLEAAQDLRSGMGGKADADWDKVIIMGKQICPDEALFADATAAAGEVDLDLEAGDGDHALDLAFDDQSESAGEMDLDLDAGMDLDLGSTGTFGSEDMALEGFGDSRADAPTIEEPGLKSFSGDDRYADSDGLDIGERTSAGLEAALFGMDNDDDDTVGATTPDLDVDSLAATLESPTVETHQTELDEEDWSGVTMESPTLEAAGPDAYTVEMSSVDEDSDSPTVESPTLETTARTVEQPTVEQTGLHHAADLTAELDLDDLGLDVKDLENLPGDLGDLPSAEDSTGDTREQPAFSFDDDDLLSATGVTQVLRGDEEGLDTLNTAVMSDEEVTMLAPGLGDDTTFSETLAGTEVLERNPDADADFEPSSSGVDLNLDDLSEALDGADTVEQPRASSFGGDIFGGNGHTPVDLDVGADFAGNDDPTGTEEVNPLDPQTMTEVGTKLDLARAYIDMGDPEGAKSILEEVLDEGDSGQRREAQTLIDVLSA